MDVDMLVILNDNDMSISENVGAFSNYFARVLSGKLYATLARRQQESAEPHADRVGAGASLRRTREGHGVARHDLRGDGLQLHRPDRRPRSARARRDAEEPARSERPAVPARDHAQGQGLRAGRSRSDQVARPRPVRSEERRHLQGEGERPAATRRCSVNGCATWPSAIRAWSASRRRCAKARDSSSSRSASPIATSTSPSPSSTR